MSESKSTPRQLPSGLMSPAAAMLALLLLSPTAVWANEWAINMVDKTSHDFGAVARGSDSVYKFAFKNTYKEDIFLKSVSSSCGCTSPSLENKQIKTYDTGYVVAKFNTRTFTGPHSATLTVRLEFQDTSGVRRPAQVQLRVQGDIRGDIVFQPGSINLGTIEQGAAVQKSVSVTYAGRPGWAVEDVRSTSDDFEVELVERRRQSRNVAYDLVVRLRESASPGLIKQQLVLVTNDSRNPRVPLEVSGQIKPQLSVAPASLVFGEAVLGTPATKRLIVRGKKPFRITSVDCGDDGCFQIKGVELDGAGDAKARHLLQVVFDPQKAGTVKRQIVFRTDLGETYTAACTAYATVVAPAATPEDAPDAAPEGVPGASGSDATAEATAASEERLAQGD